MTETIPETRDDAQIIAALLFAATTGANRLQQTAAIDEAVRFIRALMAQRTRQEERVRVLEEALRPFARFADAYPNADQNYPHSGGAMGVHDPRCPIYMRDYFRARAALGNGGGDA